MDRISALRNVEEALREFEAGDASLAATERRVATVLRTYATEFEGDEQTDLAAYRARGPDPVDGTVVVAASPAQARERVRELCGLGPDAGVTFDVDPL